MTPDDMEGLSANLLADLGVLAATAREVPFDVWDRFANNVQQGAALLLAYQERGRALERIEAGLPEIRAAHRFSETRLIARPFAPITVRSHSMPLRTPAPEGEAWRTVPVEPTEAMIAAANALWGDGTGVNYVQLDPEDFYAAMLAASPVVPVGVSEADLNELHMVCDTNQAATDDSRIVKADDLPIGVIRRILAALRPTETGRE
jgi:hypothetical protein